MSEARRRRRYLTDAEKIQLRRLIADGRSHLDIAALMRVSTSAVSYHRRGHCGSSCCRLEPPPPVPQIQHPPASADSQQQGDDGEDV